MTSPTLNTKRIGLYVEMQDFSQIKLGEEKKFKFMLVPGTALPEQKAIAQILCDDVGRTDGKPQTRVLTNA